LRMGEKIEGVDWEFGVGGERVISLCIAGCLTGLKRRYIGRVGDIQKNSRLRTKSVDRLC